MGNLINKAKADKKRKTEIPAIATEKTKRGLYKPISEFSWKNASPAEIHKNSHPAYKKYSF